MNSRQSNLIGKTVLIAGGSGFIGRHLTRRLAEGRANVFAVSRKPGSSRIGNVQWIEGDLSEIATARRIFSEVRPEIVYHLCGHPDGTRDPDLIIPILYSDLHTTINLLIASQENPVSRFIMTASLEEPSPGEAPTSPYAAAKVSGAAYAQLFQLIYSVPVVRLRPYMSYGPFQPERKVVASIIKSFLAGAAPKLSSGTRLVDWIYIEDVADAFTLAASAPGIEGQTIDLGSGVLISIRDVANKLCEITNSALAPAFGALPDRPFEQVRAADTHSAFEKLGWRATTDIDEGLRRTVGWWREQKEAAENTFASGLVSA